MQAEVLDSVDPHGKAPVLVGGGEDWFLKGGDACCCLMKMSGI